MTARDVPPLDCVTLTGEFVFILRMALGFADYLIRDEVPTRLLERVPFILMRLAAVLITHLASLTQMCRH